MTLGFDLLESSRPKHFRSWREKHKHFSTLPGNMKKLLFLWCVCACVYLCFHTLDGLSVQINLIHLEPIKCARDAGKRWYEGLGEKKPSEYIMIWNIKCDRSNSHFHFSSSSFSICMCSSLCVWCFPFLLLNSSNNFWPFLSKAGRTLNVISRMV